MLVIDGKLKGKDMIESGIAKYVEKAKQAAENLPTPMNPEEHRAVREALIEASPITPPSGMSIRNTFVNAPGRQIGIRVYLPEESKGMPPVLFFHGGGFVSGSIFTHDIYAISIAEFTGLPVISVNYRLAPENAYPSALDDCYFVLQWVIDHGSIFDFDASRIIIGGDSAGGNLAAALALKMRDENRTDVIYQYLIFPCLDTDFETDSYLHNKNDPFLSREQMIGFWNDYLRGKLNTEDYLALPQRCHDLSGLPPAYILAADLDPLRDDALLYGKKMARAGVPVTVRNVEGAIHGFVRARFFSNVVEKEILNLASAIRQSIE